MKGIASNLIVQGDCMDVMRELPDQCVDLVFDSPPYENARTYGIGFRLKGQAWVDWMVERMVEALRVCRGLVCTVVEGKTKQFRYSATPILLMADLHRRGIHLRKPPIFKRVGIPGSGGPDWLRNDYEFIVCCTNGGKLPWSDNTAMGHPPKWAPGGAMSNRHADGIRKNARDHSGPQSQRRAAFGRPGQTRKANGQMESRPKSRLQRGNPKGSVAYRLGTATRGHANGDAVTESGSYDPPVLANPGNVIECIVGGGVMGDRLCHENEAPFPEDLAEFLIRSFCPPGGIVLDRFCGSGTTLAMARACGRKFIGIDIRESQCDLSRRRVANVTPPLVETSA